MIRWFMFSVMLFTLSCLAVATASSSGPGSLVADRPNSNDCGHPKDAAVRSPAEKGYVSLFNGRNLDGWLLRRANRNGYVVENGLLVCPADGGGYLFTKGEYSDFSLRFEFRLSKGANNGVAIRTPLLDKRPAYDGIEIQILDNVGFPRKLRPAQYHGSIYDVVPAKKGALKPVGKWNEQEILCCGHRITVIVNKRVVLDANLDKVTTSEVRKKHPGLQRTGGHIGLLGHNSRVEFRRIRVKKLSTGKPVKSR